MLFGLPVSLFHSAGLLSKLKWPSWPSFPSAEFTICGIILSHILYSRLVLENVGIYILDAKDYSLASKTILWHFSVCLLFLVNKSHLLGGSYCQAKTNICWSGKNQSIYRIICTIGYMGWVNFDLIACSTLCPLLPGLMEIWKKWLGSQATCWNSQIKVNPAHVFDHMNNPEEQGCFKIGEGIEILDNANFT